MKVYILKLLEKDLQKRLFTADEAAAIYSYFDLNADKVLIPGTVDFYISRSSLWSVGSKMRAYKNGIGKAPKFIPLVLAEKVLLACEAIDNFMSIHDINFAQMTYEERSAFDDLER